MLLPHEAPDHVGAHSAKTDHPDFHDRLRQQKKTARPGQAGFGRSWTASRRRFGNR